MTSSSRQKKERLKRSVSHDATSTQMMDELERDVYSTIAASTVRKSIDQREKGRGGNKKEKQRKSGGASLAGVVLPPLKQQPEDRRRSRSRSKSVGGEGEAGREGEGEDGGRGKGRRLMGEHEQVVGNRKRS